LCVDGKSHPRECVDGLYFDFWQQSCRLPENVLCVNPTTGAPTTTEEPTTTEAYKPLECPETGFFKIQHEGNGFLGHTIITGKFFKNVNWQ